MIKEGYYFQRAPVKKLNISRVLSERTWYNFYVRELMLMALKICPGKRTTQTKE